MDKWIFEFLTSRQGDFLKKAASFFSDSDVIFSFFLFFSFVTFLVKRFSVSVLVVGLVVFLCADFMCGTVVKNLVQRERPVATRSVSYSFPSCHVTNSAAMAAYLSALWKPQAPILWTWTLLVAYSRVASGSHWPSDVLGGLILGTLVGLAGARFRENLLT